MSIEIPNSLSEVLDTFDQRMPPIDEHSVASELNKVADVDTFSPAQRKAFDAEIYAFNFQPARGKDFGVWGIFWHELSSVTTKSGETHLFPDIKLIDAEILEHWNLRSQDVKHPVLKARYSDLIWEVGKYFNKQIKHKNEPKRTVSKEVCTRAVNAYVESVEKNLFEHEFTAWDRLERSLALSISVKDGDLIQVVRKAILNFTQTRIKSGEKWMWSRFDKLMWENSIALQINDDEKKLVIEVLENTLRVTSDSSNKGNFDPHFSTLAADRLQRWYTQTGQKDEAKNAIVLSCKAFESAAELANATLAIAWLQDLIPRYKEAGLLDDVARIEQLIYKRFKEPDNGMATFETSIEVSHTEMDEYVQNFLTDSKENSLELLAIHFMLRKNDLKDFVHKSAKEAPLSALIGISLINQDGLTVATIGSIEDDLEGRLIHQATTSINLNNLWLDQVLKRVLSHHNLNAESLTEYFEHSPLFPKEKLSLIKAGIVAWFEKDYLTCIHILVPQVEAALREVLRCLGGSTIKPAREVNGFKFIGLGDVLHHPLIEQKIHSDILFHFKALYIDARGINLRNELAHGLIRAELLDSNTANHVIHSLILLRCLIKKVDEKRQ
ncbi:protein of unknown function [Methylophilus rhizosphaerae]|uniref:Uncharacterized protein n=1 Tax=Methylophilus rhizosphaerae TaxID=492660 RepID=A0A1G9CMR6_9PROT|nr:DUF4209 domain-containing protein [Methylophilus rhizosphaerae]SDK52980.1 protein of unknown function [Methylophilus rhizosphaerae]